jgi:hypothetical protein
MASVPATPENAATDAPEATAEPQLRLAAPSWRGVVRIVAIVVACAVALALLWRVRGVVRLVAISLFLAVALNPIVDALDGRVRAPRGAVILALYLYHVTATLEADVRALPRRLASASGCSARALDVNPLVTIVGVLAGASLLGILGALLAIPVAAAIQILLRDWWGTAPRAPSSADRCGVAGGWCRATTHRALAGRSAARNPIRLPALVSRLQFRSNGHRA